MVIRHILQFLYLFHVSGYDGINCSSDENLARALQFQFDQEIEPATSKENQELQISINDSIKDASDKNLDDKNEEQLKFPNYTAAIKTLKKKIDDSGQFYLVVRRGCPFLRQLSLWQREARKRSPEKALVVKFAAEDGIDDGALAREYLTRAVSDLAKIMFPTGAPTDSMLMFTMAISKHVVKLQLLA